MTAPRWNWEVGLELIVELGLGGLELLECWLSPAKEAAGGGLVGVESRVCDGEG